jgi:hypothetical protein
VNWLDPVTPLIGLVTVLLVLAIVVTGLAQATAALLRLRGRNLYRGLEFLLRQASVATQQPGDEKPIGLVVVHGVGKQEPGATRESVVRGLKKAYPEARFETRDQVTDMIYRNRRVRIYEAYWAPVLTGDPIKGSFSIHQIHEAIWFPTLNNGEPGSKHQDLYPKALVRSWTRVLIPLGVVVTGLYWFIRWPLGALGWLLNLPTRENPWVRPGQAFDDWLADHVSDVSNYVNACARAAPAVPNAHEEIYGVLHRTLSRAGRECSEVQILAHSLGSVIVDHALTRFGARTREVVALKRDEANADKPPLTHLYTIGTPLEKILFFWPKIIQLDKDPATEDYRWDNFSSHADVISGTMKLFRRAHARGDETRVENHKARGTGGILTAHTGYRTHPSFLHVFGPGLTKFPTKAQPSPRWRWLWQMRDWAETLVVGVMALVFALLGFVLVGGAVYGAMLFVLRSMETELTPLGVHLAAGAAGLVVALIVVVLGPFTAKATARVAHAEHWTTVPVETGGPGTE